MQMDRFISKHAAMAPGAEKVMLLSEYKAQLEKKYDADGVEYHLTYAAAIVLKKELAGPVHVSPGLQSLVEEGLALMRTGDAASIPKPGAMALDAEVEALPTEFIAWLVVKKHDADAVLQHLNFASAVEFLTGSAAPAPPLDETLLQRAYTLSVAAEALYRVRRPGFNAVVRETTQETTAKNAEEVCTQPDVLHIVAPVLYR